MSSFVADKIVMDGLTYDDFNKFLWYPSTDLDVTKPDGN